MSEALREFTPAKPEKNKPIYFGMGCFNDNGFQDAVARLILAAESSPVEIVYTKEMKNQLDRFKEEMSTSAPEVTMTFTEISAEVYKKLNDRYLTIQDSSLEKLSTERITPDNWEQFRKIRLQGLQTDPASFRATYEGDLVKSESDWRARLGNEDRIFIGIKNGEDYVSVAGAYKQKDKDSSWMIMAVYTSPDFRGKGLSKRVLNTIIDSLPSQEVQTVQLTVNTDQSAAVHLYEKLGFKVVETLREQVMGDGHPHDEYLMELNLNKDTGSARE